MGQLHLEQGGESFAKLEEAPFPAIHDQRHEVKIVNVLQMGRWHLSEIFIHASGKPYTEPVGLESVELPFGTFDRVVVGEKNGGRLPAYHRLDLTLNREFSFGDGRGGLFSVTLFNLYNRQNPWYKKFNVVEGEIVENNIQLMGLTLNASLSVQF